MSFATKHNKNLNSREFGNTTTLDTKQDTLLWLPHTWVKHCPQWFKRRRRRRRRRRKVAKKNKKERKRESSQFIGDLVEDHEVWSGASCTSPRSPEISAPCLCFSVLILWISFCIHVHRSLSCCPAASWSSCTGSSCKCPPSSSSSLSSPWSSCTCGLVPI